MRHYLKLCFCCTTTYNISSETVWSEVTQVCKPCDDMRVINQRREKYGYWGTKVVPCDCCEETCESHDLIGSACSTDGQETKYFCQHCYGHMLDEYYEQEHFRGEDNG